MIPRGGDITHLNSSINGLFHALVKQVAPSVNNPVDWLIDWDAFLQQLQEDMSTHAHRRYDLWSRPPKREADEMPAESTGHKKPRI
jgi:hypothetical protein